MGKIKRLSKRGIAFILSLITIISLIMPMSLIVNADTNGSTQMSYDPEVAKGYAGSMFKTYMAGGQDDLKISDISEEEFRTFGVLLSNFVIPEYTVLNKIDEDTDFKDDEVVYYEKGGAKIEKYNVWEQFCKVWKKSANDVSLLKDLLNKYKNCFKASSMKLLHNVVDVSDRMDNDNIAYTYSLISGRAIAAGLHYESNKPVSISPLFCWEDDKGEGHVVFSFLRGSDANNTGQCIAAFCRSVNIDRTDYLIGGVDGKNGHPDEKKFKLYVSPFGDICTLDPKSPGDFIVLIPACLNPYAFETRGEITESCNKLYINNTFMMSNLCSEGNKDNMYTNGCKVFDETLAFNNDILNTVSFFNVGFNGGGDGFILSEVMHMSKDSMLPYLSVKMKAGKSLEKTVVGKDAPCYAVSGLTVPAKPQGKDESPVSVYAAAVQPLWSVAAVMCSSNNCNIGIVSRSSLLDDDNVVIDRNLIGEMRKGYNYYATKLEGRIWTNSAYGNDGEFHCSAGRDTGSDVDSTSLISKNPNDSYSFKPRLNIGEAIDMTYTELKEEKAKSIADLVYNNVFKDKYDDTEVTKKSKYETKYMVVSLTDTISELGVQTVYENQNESGMVSKRTTFYQIPLVNVVSKVGLFGTFFSDEGDIESIHTVNVCDDGEGTLLTKYGHGAVVKDGSSLEQVATGWSKDVDENMYYVAMPEYLYLLNADFQSGSIVVGSGGIKMNFDRNLFTGIYWAYLDDIVGVNENTIKNSVESDKPDKEDRTFTHLPSIPEDGAKFAETLFQSVDGAKADWEKELDEQDKADRNEDIADKIHKILNIGETIGNGLKDAARYVTNWLKAMVDSLFIGWHNHMVGVDTTAGWTGTTQNIGNATKSGVYSTAMGYMTTPTFNSLPVTGWIMANFTLIYVILMIFIVVILLMMVITRARRLPQAILIFICMAFLIILPANMLNGAISISNEAAEKIFANKFQYWAVMQHAEYITNQNIAKNANQAALLDNLDRNSESTKVGGVTLKWMAPKKWGIAEQIQSSAGTTRGLRLFLYLAGDVLDQEDYTHYQAGDTYIYRPYLALFTEAHSLYKRLQSEKIINEDSNSKTNNLYKVSQNIVNTWTKNNSKYKVLNSMGTNKLISNSLYFTSDGKVRTDKTSDGKSYASNFFRYTTHRGDSILRSAVGGTGAGKNGIMTYPLAYYDSYYHDANIITDKNNMFSNNERIYDMYLDEQLISRLFAFKVDNVYWDTNHGTIWTSDSGNYESPCGLWLSNKKNPNTRHYSGDTSKDDLDKTFYSSGVQAYFDYSESPYYYFYNVFMDMQIHTDNGGKISGSEDFLALLLSDETFKVVNQQSPAYGEFKDYLDMEGLFKFVIPLLNYGNGNAHKYFERYGSTVDRTDFLDDSDYESSEVEETTSVEESENESSTDSSDSSAEESSKESSSESSTTNTVTITKDPKTKAEDSYNRHKQQLQAIYNMYCPWVDQFLAANTKTTKIKSGYGWVELNNPCDPADYQYFGRPMAFSKAEAVIRGYKDYDLSDVETKIQKVLNDSYYDIIELINYKDLTSIAPTDADSYAAKEGWKGNEILVSAAAMIATFHFNQEFSDNGFMSTDITLYPQSYELKNMNFDAYLRIIMGNSMGINQVQLMRDDSASLTVYEKFIHETSVFSALVLIIEDVLAVFLIPILKILLITVVFVLALALAVSCIINKPEHMIKIFLTTYILPLFAMIAIFVAHTLVISWFVGEGSSAGLIDTHSISVTTGDPTVTLLLMIVVDLITVILMWKLLKFAAKSTAKYIQDIGNGIASLTKGTFSGLAKIVTAAAGIGTVAVGAASLAGGAIKSTASGVVGAGKAVSHKVENSRQTKLDKERNKLLKSGGTSGTSDKTKGKTGGSSGAGAGASNKPTNNNNSQQTNSSLAADVKAIRQKLEKGFNPEGMKQESSKLTEVKEEPKKVQAASPEASKAEKKPSAGAQKAQQLYKRKLTRKETQAAAMQSAMTGDNAGLKQAQADLDKLIAEQNALVSKYGATWNRGKKKFTSKSNNAEQNRQLNEMQRKINASRATVNTLKQRAEAVKSSAGGSGKQPRKVMKVKK